MNKANSSPSFRKESSRQRDKTLFFFFSFFIMIMLASGVFAANNNNVTGTVDNTLPSDESTDEDGTITFTGFINNEINVSYCKLQFSEEGSFLGNHEDTMSVSGNITSSEQLILPKSTAGYKWYITCFGVNDNSTDSISSSQSVIKVSNGAASKVAVLYSRGLLDEEEEEEETGNYIWLMLIILVIYLFWKKNGTRNN